MAVHLQRSLPSSVGGTRLTSSGLALPSSIYYSFPSTCCCSVAKSCLTLCTLRDCSTPGSSALHSLGVCSNSCPLIFAFSYCPWGSPGKNAEVVFRSLLQWNMFCQHSLLWPISLGWPCAAWLITSLRYASPFTMTRLWSMKGFSSITPSSDEEWRPGPSTQPWTIVTGQPSLKSSRGQLWI